MSEEHVTNIFKRIDILTLDHKAVFGTMTANQMICHCTDQLRISLGILKLVDQVWSTPTK